MRTPRPRKRKAKRDRRLGRVSPNVELNSQKELHENFIDEPPGHFMYNEEADAIQQVLKLPDITVPNSPRKSTSKNGLYLPPIAGDDTRSSGLERKSIELKHAQKLPKISKDIKNYETTSWLEKPDICSVSWGKALDALNGRDSKAIIPIKDCAQKRRRKDSKQF